MCPESYCTLESWCWNNRFEWVSRMYTMMEEHIPIKSTLKYLTCHQASHHSTKYKSIKMIKTTLHWIDLWETVGYGTELVEKEKEPLLLLLIQPPSRLGRCLWELAIEGEKRQDGDQVGGELVLLQPLLNRVEKRRRQNLKQSLRETWNKTLRWDEEVMLNVFWWFLTLAANFLIELPLIGPFGKSE